MRIRKIMIILYVVYIYLYILYILYGVLLILFNGVFLSVGFHYNKFVSFTVFKSNYKKNRYFSPANVKFHEKVIIFIVKLK